MGGELAFFQSELEFRPEHDRYTVMKNTSFGFPKSSLN